MVTEENRVVLTVDELRRLMKQERLEANRRWDRITIGLSGVFSALLPGLGHLFLRLYGWAVVYLAGYSFCWYKWLTSGAFWWIGAAGIWVVGVAHASHLAAIQED